MNNNNFTYYPIDFDMAGIIERFSDGRIYSPEYQRGFVWDTKKQSRFIETVLIGLPFPPIFLYIESDNRKTVIDGIQRLNTLKKFKDGKLKLGEDVHKSYKNKTYKDLEADDQQRFDDAVCRAIAIQANLPKDKNAESVYEIFDRYR